MSDWNINHWSARVRCGRFSALARESPASGAMNNVHPERGANLSSHCWLDSMLTLALLLLCLEPSKWPGSHRPGPKGWYDGQTYDAPSGSTSLTDSRRGPWCTCAPTCWKALGEPGQNQRVASRAKNSGTRGQQVACARNEVLIMRPHSRNKRISCISLLVRLRDSRTTLNGIRRTLSPPSLAISLFKLKPSLARPADRWSVPC